MNKYIRKDVEDKIKAKEREQERQQQTTPATQAKPLQLHMPQEQVSQIELLLIREIIRHGEEIIYNDIETDDGQKISLSVSQYIEFDLSQDGLELASPLHRQILTEAVAHQAEPGFKSETYFCSHPDMNISQLATRLAIDRYQLGGRFVMTPREDSLRQRVLQLVMTYRFDLLKNHLKDIQQKLITAGSDLQVIKQLLQEHKDTKELCDELAKRLGREFIV